MLKTNCKTIQLEKGVIYQYAFQNMDLYVYRTNDFIDDEAILLVKNGKLIVIESPCFHDNILELENFISSLQVEVEGLVLAYHMAGGSFLPRVKKYATPKAKTFGTIGGGKGLIHNFSNVFGNIFDSTIHNITQLVPNERISIGGIELELIETDDAFDIIIPEINVIYTHMLGHDCHSIIGGEVHAKALISTLEGYIEKSYDLVLTSHYDPEDLNDVKTKIDYLKNILHIAKASSTKQEFVENVKKEYPNYSGLNYLDMTAGFFFS